MPSTLRTSAARMREAIRRFLEALDGIDDIEGNHLIRLEKRVRALEAELEQLRNSMSQQ